MSEVTRVLPANRAGTFAVAATNTDDSTDTGYAHTVHFTTRNC
jgi:hypothetical protein